MVYKSNGYRIFVIVMTSRFKYPVMGVMAAAALVACAPKDNARIYRDGFGLNVDVVESDGVRKASLLDLTDGKEFDITGNVTRSDPNSPFGDGYSAQSIHRGHINLRYPLTGPLEKDHEYGVEVIDMLGNAMKGQERPHSEPDHRVQHRGG